MTSTEFRIVLCRCVLCSVLCRRTGCAIITLNVAYLLAHADLHDGVANERLFQVTVLLLLEVLNVHPRRLHKLTVGQTQHYHILIATSEEREILTKR